MQRLLAIAIVVGTVLALSGVFASSTHENDRPNSDSRVVVDIRTPAIQPSPAGGAAALAAASGKFGVKPVAAAALAAATGKFGLKSGAAKPAPEQTSKPSAKPNAKLSAKMPAIIHFKPKTVALGVTGRKAARPASAADGGGKTEKVDKTAEIRRSPARVASAPAASASAGVNAGNGGGAAAAVAASRATGSVGATRNDGTNSKDGATASAAPAVLRTPQDTCMGSSGAAGQGVDVGVSMATTWRDSNCIMLKNARALLALGNPKAAKIRLCMDDDNALAFEVVGEPCPRSLKSTRLAAAKLKEWNAGRTRSVADTPTAAAPGSVPDFVANIGNRVLFGFDQSKVTPAAAKILDRQAAWLKRHAQVTAVIEGHADARGSEKYNLALGERRAAAIRDYLVGQGVAPNRVKTISYGEARPAAQGETEAAWAQNRRGVTFVLNADGKSKMTKLSAEPEPAQSTLTGAAGPAADDWSWGQAAPTAEVEIE